MHVFAGGVSTHTQVAATTNSYVAVGSTARQEGLVVEAEARTMVDWTNTSC